MKIALDLDGTITASPAFFRALTAALAPAHEIHVVTDRPPGTEAEVAAVLQQLGITYHVIKITADKHHYVLRAGIEAVFDDADRYVQRLPETVAVFKVRTADNFDFKAGRWLYDAWTGEAVDEAG
jgi:hypothetical protein